MRLCGNQQNGDDDICSNNENNVSRSNSRNIRFQGLCTARTNDRMQLVPEEGFQEFTAAGVAECAAISS